LFVTGQTALDRIEEETVTPELDTVLRQRVVESIGMVLPRLLEREIPAVAESMLLMEELGMRSTAMLELLVELEESLHIQIDVEDIDRDDMNSVGDLADFVASHALADG
jgi:acyl carrier protein